jgi:hypothetical protein
LKLGKDADGGAPLIGRSVVGILLSWILIVKENACNFFAGFCVLMVIVIVDCNVGDFGVGILMIDGVAVLIDDVGADGGVQSGDDCVVGHVIARGVGALKLSVSLKMTNDNIQRVLKIPMGVKHGLEKISEGKFVCVSAVGHHRTWAN